MLLSSILGRLGHKEQQDKTPPTQILPIDKVTPPLLHWKKKKPLEFRSHKDDAWYEATLHNDHAAGHRRLRINFANFSDDHDEFVSANSLKSLKDIDALRSRVRRDSIQLQDHECSQVNKGLLVCAARSIQDDRRFYDGVIDKVVRLKHRYVGGEEVCACGFVVEWTSGPDIGIQTILKLADIAECGRLRWVLLMMI